MAMEMLHEALRRLERAGYVDQFTSRGDRLRSRDSGRTYSPDELQVDEIVRFEGMSDPADESLVLALRTRDGVRGTYTVAYGADMPPDDARLVPRLSRARADPIVSGHR